MEDGGGANYSARHHGRATCNQYEHYGPPWYSNRARVCRLLLLPPPARQLISIPIIRRLIGSICNTGTDPPVCLVDWTFGSKKVPPSHHSFGGALVPDMCVRAQNLYWVDLVVARCRASAELADALMGQRPDLAMSVLVDVCMGAISTRTQIVEAAVAVRTMSVLYARPDAWDYVLDLLHKTPSLATIRSALLTQIDTQVNVILRIVAPDQAKAEQMRRILQQVDECRRRVDRTPGRMCPLCDYQQLPTLVDGVSVVCPDCCNEIVLLVD